MFGGLFYYILKKEYSMVAHYVLLTLLLVFFNTIFTMQDPEYNKGKKIQKILSVLKQEQNQEQQEFNPAQLYYRSNKLQKAMASIQEMLDQKQRTPSASGLRSYNYPDDTVSIEIEMLNGLLALCAHQRDNLKGALTDNANFVKEKIEKSNAVLQKLEKKMQQLSDNDLHSHRLAVKYNAQHAINTALQIFSQDIEEAITNLIIH